LTDFGDTIEVLHTNTLTASASVGLIAQRKDRALIRSWCRRGSGGKGNSDSAQRFFQLASW